MKKYRSFFVLLFLTSCVTSPSHRGNLDEGCNPDGTCNGENLECNVFSSKCHVKTHPGARRRCQFESECFCVTCADKCGEMGVKTCAYSDTSVWGAKPAVCECK